MNTFKPPERHSHTVGDLHSRKVWVNASDTAFLVFPKDLYCITSFLGDFVVYVMSSDHRLLQQIGHQPDMVTNQCQVETRHHARTIAIARSPVIVRVNAYITAVKNEYILATKYGLYDILPNNWK